MSISKKNYSDEVPCKNHIIVGALDSELEALRSFYGGVKRPLSYFKS